MNKLYALLLALVGFGVERAAAQQEIPPLKKEFLDSAFTVLPSPVGARYRRETEYTDSVGGTMRDSFLGGRLQSRGAFDNFRKEVPNGVFETWFDDGQLESYSQFEHGQQVGELRLYHRNGQLKRRESYTAGTRSAAAGVCYRADGQQVPYFEYQILPIYPEGDGGQQAVVAAVARQVKYPMDALRANQAGRVLVAFVVNKKGEVANARIVEGVYPSIDEAALRAVRKLRRFIPGQQDGEAVVVSFTVPITFKFKD